MTVYLVGAGPGDPELLTVKAFRLLARADVVVHDRLVDDRILDTIAPWAELVDVGKRPGDESSQDRINQQLIAAAARAETVVRLKGGDPFVFGRGGEEAIALRAAGVDVVEVPGITSAIAAPAAAGVPVTHRGLSSGFTVITAHQDPATDRTLDWDAAARLGTTLVVLMGAARAGAIAERLIDGGLPPTTPVAAVERATRPSQRTIRTTLGLLADQTIAAPATIVIGAVAALDVTDAELSQLADNELHESEAPSWR